MNTLAEVLPTGSHPHGRPGASAFWSGSRQDPLESHMLCAQEFVVTPLTRTPCPAGTGAPRPAARLPDSRWHHGMLPKTAFMSQSRLASWRRESSTGCGSSSLPTGHESGGARMATPRRPSADCQRAGVYNIINIYKCRNNAFNRSLMLRELISGTLIAQLAFIAAS